MIRKVAFLCLVMAWQSNSQAATPGTSPFDALETLRTAPESSPVDWSILETMPCAAERGDSAKGIFECLDTCHSKLGKCNCKECQCPDCPCSRMTDADKKPDVAETPEIKARSLQCLVFYFPGCAPCVPKLAEIRRELPKKNWVCDETPGAHFRFVDAAKFAELAAKYGIDQFPTCVFVRDGVELTRFVDYPGYVKLSQAYVELSENPLHYAPRSLSSVQYPVRPGPYVGVNKGGHVYAWTRDELFAHLMSATHAGKFDPDWLRTQSLEQLNSIHTDDHYGMLRLEFVVPPAHHQSKANPRPTAKAVAHAAANRPLRWECRNGRCGWY